MTHFTDFIYRYNKKIMLVFLLLLFVAVAGILKLNIKTDFDVFNLDKGEYIDNSKLVFDEFGDGREILISIAYNSENEKAIIKVEKELANLKEIKSVHGLSFFKNLPIKIEGVSPIKKSQSGNYVNVLVQADEGFDYRDMRLIEETLQKEGLRYYLAGDAYMQNKILDYITSILSVIPPLVILILFTIFYIQMKSVKATLLSVFPAVLSAVLTLGIAGHFSSELSILSILAPIFTIIIGSADGLHFNAHLQDELSEGSDKKTAICKTLKMIGMPMIITTVTSVAGFLVLLSLGTPALNDLAIFASIGIALAGLVTFIILPTIHSFDKIKIEKNASKLNIKLPFNRLIGKRAIIISIIMIVLSAYGITKLDNEFNQLMFYKEKTEVAKNFEKIMEINGGAIPAFILLPYEGDPFSEETERRIEEIEAELKTNEHVSSYLNPLSILKMAKEKMKEKTPKNLPVNLRLIESSEFYRKVVSENYIRLIVYPKDLSNKSTKGLIAISEKFPDIKLAGTSLNMYELNRKVLDGQTLSLILAFVIVYLAVLFSLRKFVISLIALVPIALTALFLYGIMGIVEISLNLFTATIFSITIGVGIDYAIHYVSVYKNFIDKGFGKKEAVEKTSYYLERPVLANALGFAFGLSALALSPLKVHLYVSILMWVAMVVSATLTLTLLPTLLLYFEKK